MNLTFLIIAILLLSRVVWVAAKNSRQRLTDEIESLKQWNEIHRSQIDDLQEHTRTGPYSLGNNSNT